MSVSDIQREMERLAAIIGVPEMYLPLFGRREGYLRSQVVEAADGELSLLTVELSRVLETRSTRDPDELLYWVFSDATREMASNWELLHRISGVESRMVTWGQDLLLLSKLKEQWSERRRTEYLQILLKFPYRGNDGSLSEAEFERASRALIASSLPQRGVAPEEAREVSIRVPFPG